MTPFASTSMKRETEKLVKEIEKWRFFSNEGSSALGNIIYAKNEKDAIKRMNAIGFQSMDLSLYDFIMNSVFENSAEGNLEWQSKSQEIEQKLIGIYKIIDKRFKLLGEYMELYMIVRNHVFLSCIEVEYVENFKVLPYNQFVLPIYREGLFVCGWQGEQIENPYAGTIEDLGNFFRNGKFVVWR